MATASPVSRREVEVLTLLANGKTARQISEILGITKRTVDAHKHCVVAKLNAANSVQAVAIAVRDGFVDVE